MPGGAGGSWGGGVGLREMYGIEGSGEGFGGVCVREWVEVRGDGGWGRLGRWGMGDGERRWWDVWYGDGFAREVGV